MASYSALSIQFNSMPQENRLRWLEEQFSQFLGVVSQCIGKIFDNAAEEQNVIFYFSAFLQKPQLAPYTGMQGDDIQGFMNAMYGLDYDKDLTIVMHTPGGDPSAVETIIEYIYDKFRARKVTVVVPVMSASAGTIFALASDRIVVSRIGQLGPVDTQFFLPQGSFSVKEIIEQFKKAKKEILENPSVAHFWSPILQSYGPALYERARNVQKDSRSKIEKWLERKGKKSEDIGKIMEAFYDSPNVHNHRIGWDDLQSIPLKTKLLENNQELQDATLSVYHLATLYAANYPMVRMIINHKMQVWERYHHPSE